jgi:asparagine synthase (glutamine-hydrolysing)
VSLVDGWYYIAFPDTDSVGQLAQRCSVGHVVVPHESGRPWLVHNYLSAQMVTSTEGPTRIAVLGFSSATQDWLQTAVDRPSRIDDLVCGLDGNFSLVASVAGTVHAFGTASGVRRVFRARIDGSWVVSDRADVLTGLGAFEFDETTLAMHTILQLPHPLPEQPVWRGVEPITPDRAVVVDADGRDSRTRRWWAPPKAELSRLEGAQRLRDALAAAVATRTAGGGIVHSDLSGGFDSTPLTYFASRGPATVIAGTAYNTDPGGGEDLIWARRALPAMPQIQHSTFSLDDMPQFYEGLVSTRITFDGPSDAIRAAPRMELMIQRAVQAGARAYLSGIGGDHLLTGLPVWEHTLFRTNPVTALRRLRTAQLLEQISFAETFGQLLSRQSYRAWFEASITTMNYRDEFKEPALSMAWDHRPYWPRWLSRGHRATVADRLRVIASDVEPLAPTRGDHMDLSSIRAAGRTARAAGQIGASHGIAFETPFLDDRVVEACLSVRKADRSHPKQYKPLIRDAMRGLLPEDFLRRTAKTNGTAQAWRGIRTAESELIDLCAESLLARRGALDLDVLRDRAFPRDRWIPVRDIDATLTCAVFTRNQIAKYVH